MNVNPSSIFVQVVSKNPFYRFFCYAVSVSEKTLDGCFSFGNGPNDKSSTQEVTAVFNNKLVELIDDF